MSDVLVRAATPADQAALDALSLEVHALHVAQEPEIFKTVAVSAFDEPVPVLIERPGFVLQVAELDGAVVGYALAEVRSLPETATVRERRYLHVHAFGVGQAHRRSGVGRRLMESLQAVAEAQGLNWMTLDVWSFNTIGQAFFKSQGYTPAYQRMRLALTGSTGRIG